MMTFSVIYPAHTAGKTGTAVVRSPRSDGPLGLRKELRRTTARHPTGRPRVGKRAHRNPGDDVQDVVVREVDRGESNQGGEQPASDAPGPPAVPGEQRRDERVRHVQ